MKKKSYFCLKYYLLGLIITFCTNTILWAAPSKLCGQQIHLVFRNGILNQYDDAKENLQQLVLQLIQQTKDTDINWSPTQISLAYNSTDGFVADLQEVALQKKYENYADYWAKAPQDVATVEEYLARVRSRDIGYMQEQATKQGIYATLMDHFDQYQKLRRRGLALVIVGHSQGNLFANSAYELFIKESKNNDKMALVAVATPAERIADGGPYLTLTTDLVIRDITLLGKGFKALPANHTNQSAPTGWADHEFISSYLQGIDSGSTIINDTQAQMQELMQHNDINADISAGCQKWWKNLALPSTLSKDQCLLRCAASSVTMANFGCTNQCDYFCNCWKPQD